jgi:hypothetical protein
MTRRYELERNVIEAAEACVDTGGVKMMDLIRAVRAMRSNTLVMPTNAPVSNNHPVTSKLAAQWMEAEHPDMCALVFRKIWAMRHSEGAGLTTDELEQIIDGSHQSVSPRVTELRNEGWIRDSGRKRKTRSGRSAIVWTATNAAIEAMNERNTDGRLF